jgi:diacylglycerol kinase (ATP)
MKQFLPNNDKKTLFIINPLAGRGNYEPLIKVINRYPLADYIITSQAEQVNNIVEARLNEYHYFVAVGGDGTVNELANALVDKKNVLAVLPYGSGNGFARELGFRKNVKRLLQQIQRGEIRKIDTIWLNNKLSINVSGIGFDADVAHRFQFAKNRGLLHYCFCTFVAVFSHKEFYALIQCEDFKIEGMFYMISFANTRQFGHNAFIAPAAIPHDGFMDIVVVRPFPKILFPWFAVKMFTRLIKQSKYIEYKTTAKKVSIKTDYKKYHIDGDPVITNGISTLSIIPGSLTVLKT